MTKKLLLSIFCLITVIVANAQSKDQLKKIEKVEQKLWDETTQYDNKVPEKWQNESAVYLLRSVNYYYIRPQNSIEYTKVVRNRIKLLDQAAVTEYSEFKYKNDNQYGKILNTFFLGLKVIKPNGDEFIIDTKEETIKEEEEKKLAIPNLEKGDVIDYYFYTDMIPAENDLYRFKPVENIIEANYPILNYEFRLHTEKDFFVSFNTYNEAPGLEKFPPTDKKGKERIYGFNMNDIEENTYPRWFYPYLELPCYKFQVTFARTRGNQKKAYAFIPVEEETIKTKVTKEEVFEFYQDKLSPYGDLGQVKRFIKDNNFSSKTEMVESVFYFMRHQFYTNYIEAFVINESKIMNPFAYYLNAIFFDTEEQFVRYFAAVLKEEKIDYEILVGTKRYNGSIDELLLEANSDFILKVNTETPIYIDDFDAYATVNNISPLLENSEAYALKVAKRVDIEGIDHTTLPSTTYQDNRSEETLTISINDDFEGLTIDRISSHIGHNKSSDQKDRLQYYDFVFEDYEKYGTLSVLDRVRKKKNKERYQSEYDALLKKLKDKQQEKCKKSTSNEYSLELDDYSFELVATGRKSTSDPLEFKEHFTTSGELIKKAGPNYIFNVGKLIGGQYEINDKSRERTHNVYLGNPRSFVNEMSITIPEGYSVSGIEKLNFNVENQTGAFISSAILEGNSLIIKTEKIYKNYYEPNSNWSMMVEFLEAANDFEEAKILLKRNNS
ncbi:DUF3857 domain-containing protein [Mangrovimonas sp. TPBH4]|uniref:DUF3857 domain-containing protein n=1 Tax=Mangrovimonas sp. TPBH4 TaxID=1645914 RepID=UPI0006B5C5A8|nr:DUF3857 domain-containing protein [Mangrovimonas sp. TPBH4]